MNTIQAQNEATTKAPHLVIEEACNKFRARIHQSDERLFIDTRLEDVEKAARVISEDQTSRRCSRNLRRIQPLFDVLRTLGGAIETLCQGVPYLCFVWAPIKLLLTIADEHTKGFDQLVDAYVQISRHLPRTERLNKAFHDQPEFQTVLASIYSDILEFHTQAYAFLRRSGWKVLFEASWRSYDTRFKALLQNLGSSRDLLDKEAASLAILQATDLRQRLLEDVEKRETERRDLQFRETLAWLDLKGQDREQDELFEQRRDSREPGTCEWILRNSKVCSWLDEEDSRLTYWLRGKPGSGKTTLATYIKDEAVLPPKAIIIHCLCSYGFARTEANACSLTIRSLIAQIIKRKLELLPYIYDSYVKIGESASLNKTKQILVDLLRPLQTSYLVLDGLDECEPQHQRKILEELANIQKAIGPDSSLRVLVCSRETAEILGQLRKAPKVSLNDETIHTSRDIAKFAHRVLRRLYEKFQNATEKITEIEHEVVQKANGMFLWVQLVTATLIKQSSIRDLRQILSELPSDLNKLYCLILDQQYAEANKYEKARIKNILTLVSFCIRPLRHWELCELLVFYEGSLVSNEDTKLVKAALDICKPLIEEHDDGSVHLVHFSAREYLLDVASKHHLDRQSSHRAITIACMNYFLTCKPFFDTSTPPTIYKDIVHGHHDIFAYAHDNWTAHFQKCGISQATKAPVSVITDFDNIFNTLLTLSMWGGRTILDPSQFELVGEANNLADTVKYTRDCRMDFMTLCSTAKCSRSHRLGTESELHCADCAHDPTRLKHAYTCFRQIFESMIDEDCSSRPLRTGVSPEEIVHFRHRYGRFVYVCNFNGCSRAVTGFATLKERAIHEKMHRTQFKCSEPTCDVAVGVFPSRQALRKHQKDFHTTVEDIVLPRFPSIGNKRGFEDKGTRSKSAPGRVQDEVNNHLIDGILARLALRVGNPSGWQTSVTPAQRAENIALLFHAQLSRMSSSAGAVAMEECMSFAEAFERNRFVGKRSFSEYQAACESMSYEEHSEMEIQRYMTEWSRYWAEKQRNATNPIPDFVLQPPRSPRSLENHARLSILEFLN